MEALKYVSADSHVVEPADFWVSRLDKKFSDQAPRVIVKETGGARTDLCLPATRVVRPAHPRRTVCRGPEHG